MLPKSTRLRLGDPLTKCEPVPGSFETSQPDVSQPGGHMFMTASYTPEWETGN